MYVAFNSPALDFTMMQMVLTMKMTSFAYNYSDGSPREQAKIDGVLRDKTAKSTLQRSFLCRDKFSLVDLPTPLAYFGYTFCPTCILAGPAFEYTDYYCGLAQVAVAKVLL